MPAKNRRTNCDWCSEVSHAAEHEKCPVTIPNANGHGRPWHCYCAELRPELHPAKVHA